MAEAFSQVAENSCHLSEGIRQKIGCRNASLKRSKKAGLSLYGVHLVDEGGVVLIDYGALHLERVGQFATFHGEWLGQ